MKTLRFEINSNDEVLELLDNRYNYLFLPKFMPHQYISWTKANLFINDLSISNTSVRGITMDLQTDLKGIQHILKESIEQYEIYQFDKAVPDTLTLEHLPENKIGHILEQNGLKHIFDVRFECLIINSFDEEYLKIIEEHPLLSSRKIHKSS